MADLSGNPLSGATDLLVGEGNGRIGVNAGWMGWWVHGYSLHVVLVTGQRRFTTAVKVEE